MDHARSYITSHIIRTKPILIEIAAGFEPPAFSDRTADIVT